MLDIMRRQKDSIIIKVVFVVIVLSFVGTMFLVWGEGRSGMGGGNSSFAAKVDGQKISLEQYKNSYERIRSMYQQIYGQSIPPEMEKMLNLKKVALDNLIDNLLIMKAAKDMGIVVSMDEVSKSISEMPTFQKDGAFSFDLYQQLLKNNRMTAKDFEDGQKSELMLKKARQSVKDKVVVTDADALTLYKKEHDQITLDYVSYSPADVVSEIKLTDADLNEYLQKNQAEFKTPVKVSVSYIFIDPAQKANSSSISEDEIQTYYQKNMDKYQGKDGILPLKDVHEKAKADAMRQKSAKQSFELAADTLYKNIKSGDLSLVAKELKLNVQELPLFTAANPPAAFAGEAGFIKKALELKQGELGGPVETARGIYILKVKERKEAQVPKLSEIKSDVEQKAKSSKAVDLAKKKAEDALKQFSAKTSLTTRSSGKFTFNPKGDVAGIGASPELMEAAFKLSNTAPVAASPVKIGAAWYAFKLKERIDAPQADFDKTKDELKKKMLPKKQDEEIEKWLKDLRSKAKIEINQALIAEK